MDLNIECAYITEGHGKASVQSLKDQIDKLQNNLKEHEEVLAQLRSLPADEAVALVQRLGSTANASSVLSTLKGSAHTAYRLSERATERGLLPMVPSDIEFELCRLHEGMYPPLQILDVDSVNLEHLFPVSSISAHPAYTFNAEPPSLSLSQSFVTLGSRPTFPIDHPPALRGMVARQYSPDIGPAKDREYCDSRLSSLKVEYWTSVPISDEFAACAISLHLETYHAILGFMDADLFIRDLVDHKLDYCSAFLVSAVMSLACQDYNTFDAKASALSAAFFREAESLWKAERSRDSLNTLIAINYLAVSATWSGRAELGMLLTDEVRTMASRMSLFDARPTNELLNSFTNMSPDVIRALAHAAWGCYGWLTYYSAWSPLTPLEFPPILPIPGDPERVTKALALTLLWPAHPLPAYMGRVFTETRTYCVIVQEISVLYSANHPTPVAERVPLAFVESRYQLLLDWADSLSPDMRCEPQSAASVFIFQDQRLGSFHSIDSSPGAIYSASSKQMKHLLYTFRVEFPNYMSTNCFVNVPLLYILPMLMARTDLNSGFYLRLIAKFWKELYVRYRFVEPMLRANLVLALEKGMLTTAEARAMMEELQAAGGHHSASEEELASCLLDFKQVMSGYESGKASISVIAERFVELVSFQEFTTGLFEDDEDSAS